MEFKQGLIGKARGVFLQSYGLKSGFKVGGAEATLGLNPGVRGVLILAPASGGFGDVANDGFGASLRNTDDLALGEGGNLGGVGTERRGEYERGDRDGADDASS
jgi:hypothetical protein